MKRLFQRLKLKTIAPLVVFSMAGLVFCNPSILATQTQPTVWSQAEKPIADTINDLFQVEGIPKSFIYDRRGKLVAQSIDMRTRSQFLQMLGMAGLR